jgi:hypothetical protein
MPRIGTASRLTTLRLGSKGWDNKPEPAIICKECKYALQPSGERILEHLEEKHQISAKARRGLNAFIGSLHLPDPKTLPLQGDGLLPHPYLSIKRGLSCRGCTSRTTSHVVLSRHLSKAHGVRKGQQDFLSYSIHNYVSLRSWTQNGAREYWIVEGDRRTVLPQANSDTVLPTIGAHAFDGVDSWAKRQMPYGPYCMLRMISN